MLLYSDPRDDGYVTVTNDYPPYPAGPARNPSSIQRGTAQYLSIYPGDPTTPGYPAYEDAERTEGLNIPKIPSLPISWQNAQRLLDEISSVYTSTPDGKKVLSGKASKNYIRLANYGMCFDCSKSRHLTVFQWIPKSHQFGMPWPRFLGISKMKLLS